MYAGQTMIQNDLQVALFPMTHMNITQGRYGLFSHSGYNATDVAGKDTGIDKWYAPFDIKVEWLDPVTHTGVVVSNVKRVLMASGEIVEPRSIMIMLWHDNWIGGLRVGQIYKQGEFFYEEGTAGNATGNHIHMELSYGVFDGYPLFKLANGYWTLKGIELNVEDLFFVNSTTILNNYGYKFREYVKNATHVHEKEEWAFTPNTTINLRDYHGEDAKLVGQLKAGETYNYIMKYNDEKHVWVSNGKTWLAVRKVKAGVRQPLWGKLHSPKVKPTKVLYEGKFEKGQQVDVSTLYESHHMDRIISQTRQKLYIVHIYPEDKHPLSLSKTKGGKPIGATNTVNVYRITEYV